LEITSVAGIERFKWQPINVVATGTEEQRQHAYARKIERTPGIERALARLLRRIWTNVGREMERAPGKFQSRQFVVESSC